MDQDPNLGSPEVYREKPVLFMYEYNEGIIGIMEAYTAGNGGPPRIGDKLVLSAGQKMHLRTDGKETERNIMYFDGIFQVSSVGDGILPSQFIKEGVYWGLTLEKIGEIENEAQISQVEDAAILYAMC